MSTIQALADIISTGVASIQATCEAHNTSFPSLDEQPALGFEAVKKETLGQIVPVIAAAYQLIATLNNPSMYVIDAINAMLISPALNAVFAGNVVEILREGGPEGLHVNKIAARNDMDPRKLARILRLLANNHIFREVAPDVFRNNNISAALDTGKSVEVLRENPMDKYDNAFGIVPLIGHQTDERLKAAAYLTENLMDPETGLSDEPTKSPLHRALNINTDLWTWFGQPENVFRSKRFNSAMKGTTQAYAVLHDVFLKFQWDRLPTGSVIVDVGGGIGATTKFLADSYGHLRYVVQDLPQVIADGIKYWDAENPDALKSGLVRLQVHDFFEEQPYKDASVFILNHILHDWSSPYCTKLLRRLRAAATPQTKLLVGDFIVRYACSSDGLHTDIPGAELVDAPPPLLPSFGIAGSKAYGLDISMMLMLNSQERTVGEFIELLSSCGWQLERVIRAPGDTVALLVALPI